MKFRISPLWWPVLTLASPVLFVLLMFRNKAFKENRKAAGAANGGRLASVGELDLPAHDALAITVLVDYQARSGFKTAPGVSYLISTGRQSLIFDLGFGDEDHCLSENMALAGPDLSAVQGVVISHLHPDHMGGFAASKKGEVPLPKGCGSLDGLPCFVPDKAVSQKLDIREVSGPGLLPAGIGTTGPLDCPLFFMGPTREQTLLVRLKGKGVVVITGCGHPTISLILDYVAKLTSEPVYAVVGGLHLPVTESPLKKPGLEVQMLFGTGKPPWQRITDADVDEAVAALNRAGVKYLYLSSHDICAHAIRRLSNEINGEALCLAAGKTYTL